MGTLPIDDTAATTQICLVTLTDSLYLPGTIQLIDSWIRNNPRIPIIALSHDPTALEDPELNKRCDRFVPIDLERYAEIAPYKKRRSKRHSRTFYKFEAFADFGFARNLFLDSDILCLRPSPRLLEGSNAALLAALDTGFRKTRNYKGSPNEINSGVLSIDRSLQGIETIDQLLAIAREKPGRGGYDSGDQGIINKWIRLHSPSVDILPQDYNLIKKDYEDLSGLDACKLLHLADRKPWISSRSLPESLSPLEKLWHEGGFQYRHTA